MSDCQISQEITLLPADNARLSNFCGQFGAHLKQIEQRLDVEVAHRGNQFKITGTADAVNKASIVMNQLFDATREELLTPEDVHLFMQDSAIDQLVTPVGENETSSVNSTRTGIY